MKSTKHTSYDEHIDTVLRDLDRGGTIDETTRIRADAALERILATPRTPAPDQSRPPVRRRRALWLLPLAGATALAAVVAIPAMTGSDAPAYASWSRTPSAVPTQELDDATQACRESLREQERRGADVPAEHRPDVRADRARVVLSERRGNYVFVALATDSGAALSCLSDLDGRSGSAAGSTPTMNAPKPAPLAADEVNATGPSYSSGPEGAYALLQGRVGRDVRAVTVHANGPNGDVAVEATVTGGRFAAWWPTKADTSPDTRFDDAILAFTVDVTMVDGTVRRNAPVTGLPPQRKAPGPREVGQVVRGGGAGPEGKFESVTGTVGSEVTGLVVHVDGRTIPATLTDTGFIVQYPPTPRNAPVTGPIPEPTFDLTLRDGTVLRGVTAVR